MVPTGKYAATVTTTVRRGNALPATPRKPGYQSELEIYKRLWDFTAPGAAALISRPRPRRNAGRDDLFYARLAAEYVQRLAAGSMSPVKDIARRRDKKQAHVRDWLHEARVRNLLSKSHPGERDGTLLPRAQDILNLQPPAKRKR
jgi:hypothetical protein